MNHLLIVGTIDGLFVCEREHDNWCVVHQALTHATVTGVAYQNDILLASTTDGIFSSHDHGRTWSEASVGLSERLVRQIAFHPTETGLACAGTEPAAIFVTHDAGTTWRECSEVTHLRKSHSWFLPYSPGAGCVRAFSFHGTNIYAAAEIGGLLYSHDSGATWQLVPGSNGNPDFNAPVPRTFLHPDLHDVAIHQESPNLVYAATMRGLYCSDDGGKKWLHIYADCYIRALWLDPKHPHHIILGPADAVSVNGQIEESHDGGYSWTIAANGLTVPWRRAVVERFVQADDELLAIVSDGRLFAAPLSALRWQHILADRPFVLAAAAVPA